MLTYINRDRTKDLPLFIADLRRVNMVYFCTRCDRSFKWKGSLKRHLGRKRICRKAMYSCIDCSKPFVSHESLMKHKKLYCKFRGVKQEKDDSTSTISHFLNALDNRDPVKEDKDDSRTTLSSLLNALDNRDSEQIPLDTVIDTATSVDELLNRLMYGNLTPPMIEDDQKSVLVSPPAIVVPPTFVTPQAVPPTPAAIDEDHNPFDAAFASHALPVPFNHPVEVPTYQEFNDILIQWTDEILRLEGKFRHHLLVKDETFNIIDRMLQDGLISTFDHGNMMYINRLFIRLHDLIHMNISSFNRREIIEILANLFEMGKLTKTAFIELCVNI